MAIEEIYKELNKTASLRQKEELLYERIEQASERGENELVAQICEFILNDEFELFGANIRAQALRWLTLYLIDKINSKSATDETYHQLDDCLWKFKWIVSNIANDSDIPKEEIDDINEMMKMLYEDTQTSLAAYHKALMTQNMQMGEVEFARANYKLWHELAHDDMADCQACEASEEATYLGFIGEHERALKVAQPILSGELTCSEVPHITYAPVLFSMIKTGRIEEAKALLEKAAELIASNQRTIDQMPLIIEAAVRLGEDDLALNLAQKYSEAIFDTNDDLGVLRFYIAVSVFNKEDYELALQGAAAFDKRNENRYYTQYLQEFYEENAE